MRKKFISKRRKKRNFKVPILFIIMVLVLVGTFKFLEKTDISIDDKRLVKILLKSYEKKKMFNIDVPKDPVFYLQNNYYVDYTKYKNINKNKDILVVYFSRMGYTKKIAYDYANEVGAFILKLNTLENTSGSLGFWWCGRFSMISNIL